MYANSDALFKHVLIRIHHFSNLGNNDLTTLQGQLFKSLKLLQDLTLFRNNIEYIPEDAFVGLTSLKNLGENLFSVLPTNGLQKLKNLKTFGNEQLKDFPHPDAIPEIHLLTLSYAYHCNISAGYPEILNQLYDNYDKNYDFNYSDYYQLATVTNKMSDYRPKYDTEQIKIAKPPVICRPKPGPFMPCDDLMGWWSLRCGVWVVFLLAVLGNGTVLLVSITSRTKMDVPRFLICNLACADFFMGVYLGFLAVVDASTLGKQLSYFEIKLRDDVADQLMSVKTSAEAEQPNSTTKQTHKNPFVPSYQGCFIRRIPLSGYVCFIMLMNCIAFLIIVTCYVKMYWSIRGSQAWNSNDTRVAKRMALLVFTDFACWAPISFFSLTAAFGHELISLNDAKVFAIFVLPLNSCANPFLYAIFTKQFKKDCNVLCKRLEESAANRSLSRASNRNNVSATWGSSRRPSALNSFFSSGNEANKQPANNANLQYRVPESADSTQSTISRITKFFVLRRIKSERNVREPVELNRYGNYESGRVVHFCTTTNNSDVIARSDPSSSAASAPPDTGNRCLIKKTRSRGSILHFWKRWTESRELNRFCSTAEVQQRESPVDQTTSSSSQIQASAVCLTDVAIKAPKKYTSPYGRKKLHQKRRKRHRCPPGGTKSGSCCCANSHGAGPDIESPIDNPHPSITDDSSGEIMSSGLSDRLSFSESDVSVCFRPLPCSLQPVYGLESSATRGLLPVEGNSVAEEQIRVNIDDSNNDNNNHEYVNMTMDVTMELKNGRPRMSISATRRRDEWRPKTSQSLDEHLTEEDELSCSASHRTNGLAHAMNHSVDASSNTRREADTTIEGTDMPLMTTCTWQVDDSSDAEPSIFLRHHAPSSDKFDEFGTICYKSANNEEPSEARPLLLLDGEPDHDNKSESYLYLSTINNDMRSRKAKSCDMTDFPANTQTLCSYKPISQTSPNLPQLTSL
ncbi:hypothetical protein LSH36_737g01012 [Paralvinella palmiformis]|uniref:G-protein coupled receptors family 1 profile domain-containing protein n=1 Tax=Paralvinella palmiformis TaxID=53620 RepID=A0AAD9J112_9ANNE|nr:hypothetical protein LSH36_737g01012 [Paralvinella palmiformis]